MLCSFKQALANPERTYRSKNLITAMLMPASTCNIKMLGQSLKRWTQEVTIPPRKVTHVLQLKSLLMVIADKQNLKLWPSHQPLVIQHLQ